MTWRDCRLGDVMRLQRGHDLPAQHREDGDVPVVSSSGITGYHSKQKAAAPGVVTGRYGTLGEVFYLDRDYWPLNTALYVTDFKGNDPKFTAYFLRNALKDYQSDKAAVPGIDRNVLHELKVRAPDLALQLRIVQVLSAYDDLIDINRRRIKLLEDSVRLLFDEWFVRLRFPRHTETTVVDGLPEGWGRSTIGAVAANHSRRRIPLSSFEREARPGPYPYHGAAGVLDYLDEYIFEGRYLLVGEDGTVQTPAGTPMLHLVEGKFWVSNHAHVLQGGTLSTEFLYCLLSAYPIAGHVTGVAQPKLTQGNLNRIPVLVPSADLCTAFQHVAGPVFDQVFVLRAQIDKLKAARDLLLPRLMSGELTV